jgi:hypothetical protein
MAWKFLACGQRRAYRDCDPNADCPRLLDTVLNALGGVGGPPGAVSLAACRVP